MTEEEFVAKYGGSQAKASVTSEDDFTKKYGAPTTTQPEPQEQELNSWLGKYKDSQIGPIERALRHPIGDINVNSGDSDYSPMGLYRKANDMSKVAIKTALSMPATAMDYALHPINSLMGKDEEAPANTLVNNLMGPNTPQQDAYEQNVGGIMNSLDPQMSMPWAHAAGGAEAAMSKVAREPIKVPKAEPVSDLIKSLNDLEKPAVNSPEDFQAKYGVDLQQRAENMANQAKYQQTMDEAPNPNVPITVDRNGVAMKVDGPIDSWRPPMDGTQHELPFTNSPEDIATNLNARGNQGDLYNNNQGAPAAPYDPRGRIPLDAQNELPLSNSVQDVANQVSDLHGQMDMFGGAENQVSRGPMREIPEITPQVALRKAMDAEEAGKSAEAAFWKERAMEMVREERAKETKPAEPIHVNPEGTAADPRTMDALTRSTEGITYENVPPDGVIPRDARGMEVPRGNTWTKDENGIPVRQGLPTDTPDLSTASTVKGILNSDTGVRNDLGNAIQEANGPKLGPDEHFGAGPLDAPTTSAPFNEALKTVRTRGNGKMGGQRGAISSDLLGVDHLVKFIKAASSFVNDAHAKFEAAARYPVNKIVGTLPEHTMRSMPGMKESLKDIIIDPPSGDKILADALKDNVTGKVWKNVQSGMALAGEKLHSTALVGASRWLQTAANKTAYRDRTVVTPIEKSLAGLSRKEFADLKDVINTEMMVNKARYSPETLSQKLSPKQIDAYNKLRSAFDSALDQTNATRTAAGKEPITRSNAYAASQRNGDFGLPVYVKTTDGTKLAWFVQSETKAHANRAMDYFKKTYGDKIDWNQTEIKRKGNTAGVGTPKDILSGYQEMIQFLDKDDPLVHEIGNSIAKLQEANGNQFRGHNQRFMDKHYVHGYEGDKPWLTPQENSQAFFKAQVGYLKNSYAWNHMQEAVNNIKKLTGSAELTKAQPEVVNMIQAHLDRATGSSQNLMSAIENGIASIIPSVSLSAHDGIRGSVRLGVGVSRSSLYRFTSSVKGATYLQQLGLSPGFMIATPLQGMLAVANHRLLSNQGMGHSVIKTLVNTARDSSIAIAEQHLHTMTGRDSKLPGMSAIGREAYQWGEDNNVFTKNVMDEYKSLGAQGAMESVAKKINTTIASPERINRITVFMSFAHHLMDSGMPKIDAFRKAAEFTGHSVTSMESHDRPMIVNKMGVLGEAGYQYHSYLFNEYNQLSLLARHASEGGKVRPGPLVAHMVALMTLGGVMALPGAKMISDTWDIFKDSIAKFKPEWYDSVQGIGMKGFFAQHSDSMATAAATTGLLSEELGIDLGGRFDTSILDEKHPFRQFATAPQEMLEWGALAKAGIEPTNRRRWEQALWTQSPPLLKGIEETGLKDFNNGQDNKGNTLFRRAGDIKDPQAVVRRTPRDIDIRRLGLRSTSEAHQLTLNVANSEEQHRMVSAQQNLIAKMVEAAADGKKDDASEYARKALQLVPDESLVTSALDKAVIDMHTTPSERDKIRVQNLALLKKVSRIMNESNAK